MWYEAFSWFGDVANFIKYLIVPEPEYFHNRLYYLNTLVNSKFGGIAQLYNTLEDFFTKISSVKTAGLTFSLPNNYFFKGYKGFDFDILTMAYPYISLIRSVFSGFIFLITVIACYHKLRTFFNTGE